MRWMSSTEFSKAVRTPVPAMSRMQAALWAKPMQTVFTRHGMPCIALMIAQAASTSPPVLLMSTSIASSGLAAA